ncbi:MAG TPA: pilin [Candidatus Magasanikbacteria bacterium]|nr:pilin [Candidatus Magasanikbacteria bacterium]
MKLKKIIILAVLTLTCLVAVPVLADPFGLDDTANASGLAGYGTNIPVMIGNILGSILGLVAVIFFALMLYGGVLWMTARGDDSQTKKATGTITAAIIGIMIVLASYAITSFVFNSIGQPGTVASGALGGGSGTGTGTGNGTGAAGTGTGTPPPTTCAQKGAEFSCEESANCQPNTGISGFSDCGASKVCCKKLVAISGLQTACESAGGSCGGTCASGYAASTTLAGCETGMSCCVKTTTPPSPADDPCAKADKGGDACCKKTKGDSWSCKSKSDYNCQSWATGFCSGAPVCGTGCTKIGKCVAKNDVTLFTYCGDGGIVSNCGGSSYCSKNTQGDCVPKEGKTIGEVCDVLKQADSCNGAYGGDICEWK